MGRPVDGDLAQSLPAPEEAPPCFYHLGDGVGGRFLARVPHGGTVVGLDPEVLEVPGAGVLVVAASPAGLARAETLAARAPAIEVVAVVEPGADVPASLSPRVHAWVASDAAAPVAAHALGRAASHLRLRLELARGVGELDRLSAEYQALVAIGIQLSSESDTGALLDLILEQARRITHADAGSLYLVEREPGTAPRLRFVLVQNDSVPVAFRGTTLPVSDRSVAGYVALSGEALHLDDAYVPPAGSPFRIDRSFDEQAGYRSRSMLVVPMRTPRDEVVGVIQLINSKDDPSIRFGSREEIERGARPFPERFRALASSLASQAAVAIEKARLHGELRRALADLEASQAHLVQTERLKALGEMAGGLAHSFNNLLAVILGRVELLLSDVEDSRVQRQLATIQKAALDAADAVRRLQELTRIRRARPFETVDLNAVVRAAVETTRWRWRDVAQARGTTYDVRVETAPLPSVAGDPADLREVVSGLLVRALDEMPGGGRVSLSTSHEGAWVLCVVGDGGPGLSDEARRHLFDPRFPSEDRRSFGAGLSVAYGIVARHGGDIAAHGAPGEGTTLVVRLPVAATAPPAPAGAAAGRAVRPLRVLVIDDEPPVREVLATMLRRDGHEVAVAADGWEGVALAREATFDLVMTDLGMPGLSGWEVARLVKEMGPAVPVALVTGWGDQLDREEARRRHVDHVLAKPFARQDLTRLLAEVARTPQPDGPGA